MEDRPEAALTLDQEVAEALNGHLKCEAVYDEHAYFPAALNAIDAAQRTIWLWSPWYGKRQKALIPYLRKAKARGVKTTVFVVGNRDSLIRGQLNHRNPERAAEFAALMPELSASVDQIVHIHDMHQKILVVDEQTVFLGSLNTLSHQTRREIMVQHSSKRFARRLLEHEHADILSNPPRCELCDIPTEARRSLSEKRKFYWYWACPTKDCPTRQEIFPRGQPQTTGGD